MSVKSNDNGRAFEYVFINVLKSEIEKKRPVCISEDEHYIASQNAWNNISGNIQQKLITASNAVIIKLFELEPNMIKGAGTIELNIQPDTQGRLGDVRDIVVKNSSTQWEIGFSMKHNHFAVKHSRLSHKLDFGKEWYNIPCGQTYWNSVRPIFEKLKELKNDRKEWNALPDKIGSVYKPLLNAFMTEVKHAVSRDPNVPRKMVEYLLGIYDFWKMISLDAEKETELVAFNMHDKLGKNSTVVIPITELPTSIIGVGYDPDHSDNTVIMSFNKGWSFSFRIHNASTICEPSLKFDIQIIGMPTSLLTIVCNW
ncbi:MAG: HaeIII family restriction endonuclease [Paludibacteraceae bacterium]|nr:HaeIII family restriction endonuclease [Paludibacteraceae bacterium]